MFACHRLLNRLSKEVGMEQWAFKEGTICQTQVCIWTNLTVQVEDFEPRILAFLNQLFWRSALVDLAYPMLFMIRKMEEINLCSYDVCNPFSWALVNDSEGVYLTWPGVIHVIPTSINPTNPVRSIFYVLNGEQFPGPGNPSMYRAFLAYLYSVACNLFEAYRTYDSLDQTFLPVTMEPNLHCEFTGANEFLAPIASKLKEDLVTEANWDHANCSERLHALAEQLNHFELKDGTPT